MKVVINTCYGGFGLSQEAMVRLGELGIPIAKYGSEKERQHDDGPIIYQGGHRLRDDNELWMLSSLERNDFRLVAVVEELGERADGPHAELKVVEIPDGIQWEIDEYDGIETIHEVHRSWS